MSLQTQTIVAENDVFKGKIKLLMQKAAIAIMNEDAGATNHTERVTFANKVLDGSASVQEFSYGVMTNPTIAAHVDVGTDYDSDLEFVVNSIYNAFAGVATKAP